MCELPFTEAPELFGKLEDARGYAHCYVKRQPHTENEKEQMFSAIQVAELDCIRYRGSDRVFQLRLVEAGEGSICDHLPQDLESRSHEVDARLMRERQASLPLWRRMRLWLSRLFRR